MGKDYLPRREAELVTWMKNAVMVIDANYAAYGITEQQATALRDDAAAYIDLYVMSQSAETRSPANIIRKDHARVRAVATARRVAQIAQTHPNTSDAMRSSLGITVPKQAVAHVGPPEGQPVVRILSVEGRRVLVQLSQAGSPRRGRPDDVVGATIFTHVGPTEPTQASDWTFYTNVTRTRFTIQCPAELAPGETVWVSAYWRNRRDERGPASAAARWTFGSAGVAIPASILRAA